MVNIDREDSLVRGSHVVRVAKCANERGRVGVVTSKVSCQQLESRQCTGLSAQTNLGGGGLGLGGGGDGGLGLQSPSGQHGHGMNVLANVPRYRQSNCTAYPFNPCTVLSIGVWRRLPAMG